MCAWGGRGAVSVWCVLATGPGMSQAVADQVQGRCKVVAVSDAWRVAPWAAALASTDAAWWLANHEALEFDGPKFGAMPSFRAVPGVEIMPVDTGTNSGLLGLMVAVKLGAKRVLLCGFNMSHPGEHFFGRHQLPLKSTTAARQEVFKRQFANYRPRGVEIINCTPNSALDAYPRGDLEDCLAEFEVRAE